MRGMVVGEGGRSSGVLLYIFYFIVIVLCFSAFEQGHLGQWRYGNAFSIIIISTGDCHRSCYDDR